MSMRDYGVREYGFILNEELFIELLQRKENEKKLNDLLEWLEIENIEDIDSLCLSDIAQEIGFEIYSQFTGETYNPKIAIDDCIYFQDENMFIMYLQKDTLFDKYENWEEVYQEVKDTLLKYDIIADDDFIKKYTCQVEGSYWG